ncbi:MAG TPA: M23 family metallopeptidase [Gemmatimonas sp.]|uniref:M23 family metallopeptidase n=1 Tax=Gemmatimonas sp. TaxID=1962908 RepID=UPI002ED953F7
MTVTRTLLVAAGCLGIGAAVIALGRPVEERPAAEVLASGPRVSSRWRTTVDTVRKGEPLSVALQRAGVTPLEAADALRAASAIDSRRIRAGTQITTRVEPDSGTSEIIFQLAIDRIVRLTRASVGASDWVEKEELLPWTTDTVVVGGVVNSTLTAAIAAGADAFPERVRTELAYALADILEYRVDLSRDLQKGDSVRVLVERQVAPNGMVRPGNIIAARLKVDGRSVETMRFAQGTRASYFDGEGKSMRAAFLRAPLAFRRISSVFGLRRHPILGVTRAHQGTDYAAAAGTPVRALGDGRVIFAGWKGGYGRVIEIRHTNGYVTRYGHLKGFAAGIKAGTSVAISRTIGFVGATGLATAPHLHFEVLVGGKHRDPRVALRNVTGEPLAAAQRAEFAALKARLFAQLDAGQPTLAMRGEGVRGAGD